MNMRDENTRLRELLETTLTYSHSMPTSLVTAIKKELLIKDLPSLDHIPPSLWKGTPKEKRE